MLIIKKTDELKDVLFRIKSNGKSIGFVPTMGALHQGHLSLVERARKENEVVVCSIFVNPTQFNNASDLAHYPRTFEDDIALLEGVDIVFAPEEEEVYPEPPQEIYQIGVLGTVMEGAARPGHFNGVLIVVKRLLDWIDPDKAYFGEKDFQQLAIIKHFIKEYHPEVEIISCATVREPNGLAMSSRNQLLSEREKEIAANIYRILRESKTLNTTSVQPVKDFVTHQIAAFSEMRLDYFEVADDVTLQPVNSLEEAKGVMGFIAVFIGKVRLIDNLRYK